MKRRVNIGTRDMRVAIGISNEGEDVMQQEKLVLIVEDDGLIRGLCCDVFLEAGFVVMEAENADGALALLEACEAVSAVVTDVRMQGKIDGLKLSRATLPALRASNAAAIVNISSNAAMLPLPFCMNYGAAKAALNHYSRTLAVELGASGIRVNVVSPGPISTVNSNAMRAQFPISPEQFAQSVPLGCIGDTDDIAEVVALLASDRGKFLTGVNYFVDGGMARS
jgi:CheY-like chemotaxis protein